MYYLKRIFFLGIILTVLSIAFVWISNVWIVRTSNNKVFNDVSNIPSNDVGLLLGTVRYLKSGYENLYFKYRIQAATELYKAGKIKHILVSGDNHKHGYNEPEDMQQALVEAGVPIEHITLDFAGFRTLDSVVRCKEVFSQNKYTIISQPFHNQRAVFIAQAYDMDVIAFNAADVPQAYGRKTRLREIFAKVKAVLDVYVLRTTPKFLGKKEHIPL